MPIEVLVRNVFLGRKTFVCVKASMGRGEVRKGFFVVHALRCVRLYSFIALCALALSHVVAPRSVFAQFPPGLFGGSSSAADGVETAEKLKQGKDGKNTFRVDQESSSGGVASEGEVLENMRKLFDKIYLKPEQAMTPKEELDKWFSPHLRDLDIDPGAREEEAIGPAGRAWAGVPVPNSLFCYGACPGCFWPGEHQTPLCCGVSTDVYSAFTQPTNFKACCVRKEDEWAYMEEIACKHPMGDGWAGLFEYYFPVNAVGWEPQRGTTMIASRDRVQACMGATDKMMENSEWVTQAIQKGADVTDDSIRAKVADSLQNLRPKDKSLRFTDSLQGGGLTMRVNFAHMDPQERRALAVQFCMHPDQFMKLMDPRYDTKQIMGGPTLEALQALPIWANYCPQAVKLMTDPKETSRVFNTDGTKTNFTMGMMAYAADPLYCQKMNVMANPKGGEFLLEGVLKKQGLGLFTEQMVGYTCRVGDPKEGGFSTRMVPVELHSTAKIDPRTLDHAIPFLHAAGYYPGEMSNGVQSIYKRFEPMPYTRQMDLFTGKKWEGEGMNELFQLCRSYDGEDYEGADKPDQLYISDVNHKPFTQDKVQEFNKYDREWADKEKENFHNRNFDENVLNYAAAFRVFATCPAGYVRWRNPAAAGKFAEACGEENFGGITPPPPL
ncbi:MAG: hypothetical protein RL518_2512 [Pseudomonadota bacterium]